MDGKGLELSQAIRTAQIATPSGVLQVTVSTGVAGLELATSLHALMLRADAALYQAKRQGCVVVVLVEALLGGFALNRRKRGECE